MVPEPKLFPGLHMHIHPHTLDRKEDKWLEVTKPTSFPVVKKTLFPRTVGNSGRH